MIEYGKGNYEINYGPYANNSKLHQQFLEDSKKQPYRIIETEDYYDPEGLNIPSEPNCRFAGTKEECELQLARIKAEAHNRQEQEKNEYLKTVRIKAEGENYVTIYYPCAIARTTYTLVKNEEQKVYTVRIPVYAYIDVEVKANNEKEAMEIASEVVENEDYPLEFGDFAMRDDWRVKEK